MYSFLLEKISFQEVVTAPLEERLSGHCSHFFPRVRSSPRQTADGAALPLLSALRDGTRT